MKSFKICSKDHAYQVKPQKADSMIKTLIKEGLIGQRPLGRPRLKWEDYMKRDVKVVNPSANWREVIEDRER